MFMRPPSLARPWKHANPHTASMFMLDKRSGNVPGGLKCEYYAEFMRDLPRGTTDAIFFGLYVFIMTMLYISAAAYDRKAKRGPSSAIDDDDNDTDVEKVAGTETQRKRFRIPKKYKTLSIVILCFLVSSSAAVMCVYAIMGIWFCHHEDLISLYWGFWLLGPVGANIAMLGTIVQEMHDLFGTPRPIYTIALATPIPVLVGCVNFVHQGGKKMNRRMRKRDPLQLQKIVTQDTQETAVTSNSESSNASPSSSQVAAGNVIVPFRVGNDCDIRWRQLKDLPPGAVRIFLPGFDGGDGTVKGGSKM